MCLGNFCVFSFKKKLQWLKSEIKTIKRILYSDDDDDVSLNMLHNTQSSSKNRRINNKIWASASISFNSYNSSQVNVRLIENTQSRENGIPTKLSAAQLNELSNKDEFPYKSFILNNEISYLTPLKILYNRN